MSELRGVNDTPTNFDEYERRFEANQRYSGRDVETTLHSPCPFCAAPGFMEYKILDAKDAMERGATCGECGRGCRAIFTVAHAGSMAFEFVQTGGDDPPMWVPKMRRADPAPG